MFKNSKKLLASLLILLTFSIVSSIAPAIIEAKPRVQGIVRTQTGAIIPPSVNDAVPSRVIWRWEQQEDDGDWEERGGILGQPGVFENSRWETDIIGTESNRTKMFHFIPNSGESYPGCVGIRNRQITIESDATYPGTFNTLNEYVVIEPDGTIRTAPTLDEAVEEIVGNNDWPIRMKIIYTPPAPPEQPLACLNLNLTRTAMMAGESTTLTSTATGDFTSAWYTVFNRDHLRDNGTAYPVCVPGGNPHPDCPTNSGPLVISAQRGTGNTASATVTYDAINVIDTATNQRVVRPSFTAYFSRNGQITPPINACIKPLDLVSCGGVSPSSVSLSPTNPTMQVNATSIPNAGLEGVRYGLYQAGNPVCGDPAVIAQYEELAGRPDSRCTGDQQHVFINGYVQNTGDSLIGTGVFKYDSLRNFIQQGQTYNYTAFVRVLGREVGSQQQCIGSLSITTPSTTPAAQCASKRAFAANGTSIIQPNTQLEPGTEFIYRIFVDSNNRQYDILDEVPAQLQIIGLDPANPGCAISGNRLTCDNITSNVVSLRVRVREEVSPGTFTNSARITDQGTGSGNGTVSNCSIPLAVPEPPPTNTPGPMCMGIRLNTDRNPPQIGDAVSFTCGQVAGVTNYEFRYRRNAEEWVEVDARQNPLNQSEDVTITDWGSFEAQCRICVSGRTCQPWESQ